MVEQGARVDQATLAAHPVGMVAIQIFPMSRIYSCMKTKAVKANQTSTRKEYEKDTTGGHVRSA